MVLTTGPTYTCLALWKHHVNLLLQSFRSVSSDLHLHHQCFISADEDPSLRIESSAIINICGVSSKLNKYIVFTMQTYKKLRTNIVQNEVLHRTNKYNYCILYNNAFKRLSNLIGCKPSVSRGYTDDVTKCFNAWTFCKIHHIYCNFSFKIVENICITYNTIAILH